MLPSGNTSPQLETNTLASSVDPVIPSQQALGKRPLTGAGWQWRVWRVDTVRFLASRLAQAVIVLLVVTLVVFLLARLSGDPAKLMAPPNATKADIKTITASLRLNRPLYIQFGAYLAGLAHGDLGQSYSYAQPVRSLIAQALPNTIELALVAFALAAVLGAALGTIAGLTAGSWLDKLARGVALLGQSIPSFALGLLLILVFSVKMHALPAFGSGSPQHLVLPAIALGAYPLAAITRLTRSATLEVLRMDHVRFIRSKGVSAPVFLLHLWRNVSLPVVTLSGVQLGYLLSGSIIVESLFAWPGMGQLAIQALVHRDYNVVQGVVLVDTVIFVLLNLAVDFSYSWLDPRVRRVRHAN
jgi:peptide/nickel transport system permease protein